MEEYRDSHSDERKGADTALVLGILSIVFVAICQIAGLIMGIIGLHKARKSETGWVLNVIGIVLNSIVVALVVIALIFLFVFVSDIADYAYYW